MPDRTRSTLFRESLKSPPSRRLGRGVAVSLAVHLLVLWGFQRFTALGPTRDELAMGTREIRASGPMERPESLSRRAMEGNKKSQTQRGKPRVGRIGGRLAVGGAAAAGFRIEARRAGGDKVVDSAILDPAGRFMLGLLPAGMYEFSLWHEDRLVSRIQARIRSGAFLDLEWTPDLNARLRPAGKTKFHQPDPRALWRLFRDPAGRRWRDNLESMLSRAGVSREARFARRRAEGLWRQCSRAGAFMIRGLRTILDRVAAWIGAVLPQEFFWDR